MEELSNLSIKQLKELQKEKAVGWTTLRYTQPNLSLPKQADSTQHASDLRDSLVRVAAGTEFVQFIQEIDPEYLYKRFEKWNRDCHGGKDISQSENFDEFCKFLTEDLKSNGSGESAMVLGRIKGPGTELKDTLGEIMEEFTDTALRKLGEVRKNVSDLVEGFLKRFNQ